MSIKLSVAESITRSFLFLGVVGAISACGGGGGGGGSDDVVFSGTVERQAEMTTTDTTTSTDTTKSRQVGKRTCPTTGEGIEICARESCSTSSSKGEWGFSVANFGGKKTTFSFTGCGVEAEKVVGGIKKNSRRVDVAFAVIGGDTVDIQSFSQSDDASDVPEPSATP